MSRDTLNFLDTLTSVNKDTIIVLTQDFQPAFPNARPLKVTVKPTKKSMEHPIETGGVTTDHVILNPLEIELSIFIAAGFVQSTYDQINQFNVNSTLLIVQTRAAVYTDQYITDFPHEENWDQFDAIEMTIKLKQKLIVTSDSSDIVSVTPSAPSHMSTVDTGIKNSLTIDTTQLTPSAVQLLGGL